MPEDHISAKLMFTCEHITYEHGLSGYEKAFLSDGVSETYLTAYWNKNDSPLLDLISAVARLRLYEESRCEWPDLPDRYTWLFRREDDLLLITIQGFMSYSQEERKWKEAPFSITCDLWKFATKLRRECNRIIGQLDAEKKHGGDWLRQGKEYQALSELIEEHKREEMSSVSRHKAQ